MTDQNQSPGNLAASVSSALPPNAAPEVAIRAVFETMYFASLHTEEGVPITFHIVYLDPENPDPKPPQRMVQDRWACVPLQERLPFSVSVVAKIAPSTDPRSSSLAVYHDEKADIFIWGLIDQGNRYYDFVTYNADSGPERPGLFQASIVGVGRVIALRGYQVIGDFHVNRIRERAIDAIESGPLHQALSVGIRRFVNYVRTDVGIGAYARRDHWDASLESDWLASVRRLLLRIQQYRHGGAVLISSSVDVVDLSVKFRLDYDRLRTSLRRGAIARIAHTNASDKIHERYLEGDAETIPVGLYLKESVALTDLEESESELDGALWFISLLSRVDGVVVLSPDLVVSGFGGEIRVSTPPTALMQATDEGGTKRRCIPLDYYHFGTRHRSMMRYCAKVPGSVGLVVSQDGDVRAMTQVDGTLLFWDNLQLRNDDFRRT